MFFQRGIAKDRIAVPRGAEGFAKAVIVGFLGADDIGLPPVSVPSAAGRMPPPTAEPEPEDDPPG